MAIVNDQHPANEAEEGGITRPQMLDDFGFYSYPALTEEDKIPPEFIVEGLVPVGMTVFTGKPKTRKSFMMLQMASCVATGIDFLGHRTKKCEVAYFDIEGSKSRISTRVANMTVKPPKGVHITNELKWHFGSTALTQKLKELHQAYPAIRLIIIDTYGQARGMVATKGANAYDTDVTLLSPLQRMAQDEGLAIVLVHHDRKGADNTEDLLEKPSGTMGITGTADSVLNITRPKNGVATLFWTPRDAVEGKMEIYFSPQRLEWQASFDQTVKVQDTAVGGWIISAAPNPATQGEFFSYDTVYVGAYGRQPDDKSATSKKIIEQVKQYTDDLFHDFGIAVQLGVKNDGKRGIRIFSVR